MSKKQKCPEFENHERWLVSYADMVTLLFAVFVVLYALSISGDKEVVEVSGSLQESFNTPLDEIPIDRRVGPKEAGMGIFDHFKGDQIHPNLIKKYPGEHQETINIDTDIEKLKLALDERLYGPKNFRDGGEKGQERIISIHRTETGLSLRLLARQFFGPGETKIRREALTQLDVVAGILKELDKPIVIEGHTDSVPMSGEYSNWELSTLRATAVLRYLLRQHNFPSQKIAAAGYADVRPVAHNSTEAGRALNRRIEIQINYKEKDAAH